MISKRKILLFLIATAASSWLAINMPLARFGIRLNMHVNDWLSVAMPARPPSGRVELVGLTGAKFRSFGTYKDLEDIIRTIMAQKPLFAISAFPLPTEDATDAELRDFVKFAARYSNLYFFSDNEDGEPGSAFVHPILRGLQNVFIPISADRGPSEDGRMRNMIFTLENRPSALFDILRRHGIEREVSDFATYDRMESKQAFLRFRGAESVAMTPYRDVLEGRHPLSGKMVIFGHPYATEEPSYRVYSPFTIFGGELDEGLSAAQRLGVNLETILQKDSIGFVSDSTRAWVLIALTAFYFAGVFWLPPVLAFYWGFLTIAVWAGVLMAGYVLFSEFLFIGQFAILTAVTHFIVSSVQLTRYLRGRDRVLAARERALEIQEMQARLVVKSARADSGLRIATQVAHDIRSPLSALTVSAQRAKTQVQPEVYELMMNSIGRVQKIADDLLRQFRDDDFADSAKVFDLVPLLEALAESYRLSWSRVEIRVEGDPALRVPVPDPVGFERALSNLINNALEALDSAQVHGPRVTLSTESAGETVAIHIRDNGPGVPHDVAAKIFERGKTFGKESGSGLGLYQAREAARMGGGDLILKDGGSGAHFVYTLPFTRAPKGEIEIHARVAVVEDNADVRRRWTEKIKAAGAKPAAFASPEEFLRAIPETPFTLLTDLMFENSEETGFHLLNRCQRINCQKILCSSLSGNVEVQAMALKLADLAVTKTAFENIRLKIKN